MKFIIRLYLIFTSISGMEPDRDNISRFDTFDDRGSDWPLMKNVVRWCLYQIN